MKSTPRPGVPADHERSVEAVEVEISDEEFPELSAFVDEAFDEIKAGKTRLWP